MSVRNSIAENFVTIIKDATDPQFVLVTRAPIDPQKISNAQFPCAYVEALNESRTDLDMKSGNSSGSMRQSVLTMNVVCFVRTSPEMMDKTRNDVIERMEEALSADQTRGNVADYTELKDITVDNSVEETIGKIELAFEVGYRYRTGEA